MALKYFNDYTCNKTIESKVNRKLKQTESSFLSGINDRYGNIIDLTGYNWFILYKRRFDHWSFSSLSDFLYNMMDFLTCFSIIAELSIMYCEGFDREMLDVLF